MRAAIYSRKSKFTGKGESIENQIQLCKEYAQTHFNITVTDEFIFEDEGYSGGTTVRPQFQQMLLDAKAKKFDLLICYRLDRFSHSIGGRIKYFRLLKGMLQRELAKKCNVSVCTIKRYENNQVRHLAKTCKKIATVLGVNPYQINCNN